MTLLKVPSALAICF